MELMRLYGRRCAHVNLNYLIVHARTHRFLVEQLPIMDVFGICGYERWITGGPIYFSLTISFGTLSPSNLQHCFTRQF